MIASAIGGHVPNSYAVVTIFSVDGLLLITVDGSWSSRCLNYKYNHYHVCHWYRGSMSQFWVQMPHILMATGYCCFWWWFNTWVWSDHQIWILSCSSLVQGVYVPIMSADAAYFDSNCFTVASYDGSTQKYGQIIKYDHYHVHHGYWRLFWTWKNISIKSDYSID